MLIAIEGIDGSGKGTQARRLQEWLQTQGHTASLISFPRYSHTHFGATIGRFLNGEFGQLDQVDPHLAATLYAADRFESRSVLLDQLSANDVVVADRYVPSNMAHQGAKQSGEKRQRLQDWIEQVEYGVFELPRAELVIHLDVPAEIAQQLIAKKSKRDYTEKAADLQEEDEAYLNTVRQSYLEIAARESTWQTIPLLTGDTLRTVDEIGHEIARAAATLMESID
ncbi:MAG: dTMP kinase [Planctomycetaceae bacterium]